MDQIKKEHILAAIKEIDEKGIRFGRHSSTYDLIHKGKPYPPKLIISIANRFATGKELDSNTFAGGIDTPAFQLLNREGFEILNKGKVSSDLINVKDKFVDYIITNASGSNYFSKQFGSKKERLVDELKLYEDEYKKNFGTELFIIDTLNITNQIKIIKKNIYDKTTEFSNFSENRFSDRPRAILGKKNYIRFLEEKFSPQKTINYWIFQGNPKFYDVIGALQDDVLTTWKVAAHKDKIKIGDKVILWMSGENSGCYALAEVTSEVGKIPVKVEEIKYYKSDYDENEDRVYIKIEHNYTNSPILWKTIKEDGVFKDFKGGNQGTNFSATKEEYESILKLISKMNKLIINISWNSKDWKEKSQDKSNHEWVKNGGIPFESWNFASDAEGNTDDYIFGYAKFTNNPKITGKSIFIFYSDKKIVGFYGNGTIVEKKVDDNILNLRGDQNLSFVLENKIEDILEKGYLEDGKRIGQGGFNYLHKNETVFQILDEALRLNPNQTNEINRLKNWFLHETELPEIMNDSPNFKVPLNQILYGPPGTGKTYNTINKALQIINDEEIKKLDFEDRKAVKKLFDERLQEGQIVFSTFHQSLSYEVQIPVILTTQFQFKVTT
ncbi:EVE domain-containing protein [Flavobacterium sp. XS2P14]|uniref:EVE domain-containing protein n=1 Tax=Flavobacterium sp. XS2P14 TaxID=3401735 RepID=UPI003AABA261